jgi:hypothetical protein
VAQRPASAADRRVVRCEPRRRSAQDYVLNRSDRAVGCTLCWARFGGEVEDSGVNCLYTGSPGIAVEPSICSGA